MIFDPIVLQRKIANRICWAAGCMDTHTFHKFDIDSFLKYVCSGMYRGITDHPICKLVRKARNVQSHNKTYLPAHPIFFATIINYFLKH